MKVLVVERDELSSRILAKKLDNWGHKAVVVHSAEEARRILMRETFRLVITEIDLPGQSGTELVRFIRAMGRPRYTYVTILTAVTETTRLLETLEAGADDLLRKPLNVFEMRLRIKAAKRMLNMEDELREGGGNDGTTGLVNRQSFEQFFRVIVAENRRTKATGALMFIHVENYFDMRVSSGYQAAEHSMRMIARALGAVVRSADLVSRYADDGFCLCLQNTDWPTCRIVGEKTLARVSTSELVYEGHDLRPRLSIEAVNFPDGDMTSDAILATALRHPFDGGPPVAPRPADPRTDHTDELVGAEPAVAPPLPAPANVVEDGTAELLRRAGIDPGSYSRLSELE